jgi:NAD(P)-dependent dehydrogenase (short-subunit alcohol dehydrogenase family)
MTHRKTSLQTLQGKCALETGSSRGIGRGIALKLAERGAAVAINYVHNKTAAAEAVATIRDRGGEAFEVQCDVTRPDDLTNMVSAVRNRFGALDIFVNNALGDLLNFMRPPFEVTPDQWDEAFQSQSRAFFFGVRSAVSLMRDGGRIVAVSYWPLSHGGGFLPYFAMGTNKAALEAMCRYFAVALARRGITVNAVCPGITDDSIVNRLPQDAQDAMFAWLRAGWSPSCRAGTPEDIGGAVAALCGADAAWITGQTLAVDGGASLMNPEVPIDFQRAQEDT